MSFRELFEEKEFKAAFDEVNQFTSEILQKYNSRLKNISLVDERKEIFDAVWGNIEFCSGEIYILDSPLLQRLRKIKQLGLAYFVYCGCDYSRYYHTLGVTYLADRMAAAINRCDLGTNEEKKSFFKAIVRLAAIFHDTGHMFLSHVSEHYFSKSPFYSRNKMITTLLDEFERKAGKKPALHELLGCMIVNTGAVHELLEIVAKKIKGLLSGCNYTIDEMVEYISALIVGVPVDREILPYSSIVNGPIDADKCDYLSRDSHVTRVPVAVDVSRITQKLSVVESKDICTSELWHQDADTSIKFYELAMKDSAEKALFQLCIARTIMFDSVYYHHKVLTAETEFRNLVGRLANLKKPFFINFVEILQHTDEDFNDYFFDALKSDREDDDRREIDAIKKEFHKIYERHIAKRVVCLTPDYLLGPQKYTEAFWDSVMTVFDSEEEKTFICEIKEEYAKIQMKLEGIEIREDQVQIFAIQAPTQVFGHSKIQVPIDLRNGNQRDFKGYELVSSRETSSSSSYIVTDEDDRLLVYLATEKIFMKKYHIELREEAITCGKYSQKAINEKRNKLFLKGYYDDTPELISDTLLYNNLSDSVIEKIVKKYRSYEGPEGYKVTKEEVESFFKQLMCACKEKRKCKSLLNGVAGLLEQALFIDRRFLSRELEFKVKELTANDETLYVVALGSLRDSAKHISYFWNDIQIPGLKIETEKTLQELIELEEVTKIVFFDDGSYSGTQMVSIMQEYMGVEKRKTKEKHVKKLTEDGMKALQKRQIQFFFVAYNKSKEAEMLEELKEIGLDNVGISCIKDMSMKLLEKNDGKLFEDEEQRSLVKNVLADIGRSVMRSTKMEEGVYREGWDEDRVNNAALGYNDAQQMVFLKSSVPTYTITAFWQSGEFNGFGWKPLFRRTKK